MADNGEFNPPNLWKRHGAILGICALENRETVLGWQWGSCRTSGRIYRSLEVTTRPLPCRRHALEAFKAVWINQIARIRGPSARNCPSRTCPILKAIALDLGKSEALIWSLVFFHEDLRHYSYKMRKGQRTIGWKTHKVCWIWSSISCILEQFGCSQTRRTFAKIRILITRTTGCLPNLLMRFQWSCRPNFLTIVIDS